MAAPSLFEGCQTLIQKGHESWKSYFSKWETVAKYEEDIPESELFNDEEEEEEKKCEKRNVKQTKTKSVQSVKYKKNHTSKKKLVRKKRNTPKHKQVNAGEECCEDNSENLIEDDTYADSMQMETILKTVFTKILKTNKNEFQMFTILSQTVSGRIPKCSQRFCHQQAIQYHDFSKDLELMPVSSSEGTSAFHMRNSYTKNLNHRWNLFQSHLTPCVGIGEEIRNSGFYSTVPKFSLLRQVSLNQPQFLLPLRQSPEINFGTKNDCPEFSSSFSHVGTKLKSLDWDSGLKFSNSVCRKINREYFINRSFLEMNVIQDGKRSRNLCLRKRTNSVTLSMENSNFITPERKPPERKCFSENVPQRKRTRPSKLFFGNEEEDSESDDETEKQTPIIHCRNKKLKTEILSEVGESDSDDCESIFDRVKTP